MRKSIMFVVLATFFVFLTSCATSEIATDFYELQVFYEEYSSKVYQADTETDMDANSHEYERCECGASYAHEVARPPTPPININERDGHDYNFLATFDDIYLFSFADRDTDWRSRLVFWTDEPLRDVSFISLGFAEFAGRWYHYVQEVPFTISELLPGKAFVLDVNFAHYLIPRGGLRFVDGSGELRHMLIIESMAGTCRCWPWFYISYFDDRTATTPERLTNSVYPTAYQRDFIMRLLGDFELGEVSQKYYSSQWQDTQDFTIFYRKINHDNAINLDLKHQIRNRWDMYGDFGTQDNDVILVHIERFNDTWLMIDEGDTSDGQRRYAVINFE